MLDIVNCLSVLDIAVLFVMQSMTIRLKSAIEHKFYARIQMKFLCMFCREILLPALLLDSILFQFCVVMYKSLVL